LLEIFEIVGRVVLSFWPINNSAGLYQFCKGDKQYVSNANNGSSFFDSTVLMVFTACSASLLACACWYCDKIHHPWKNWNFL